MGGKIIFDSEQNPAKNFSIIIKDLEEIARDNELPMTEIIDKFVLDLRNYYKEDYEKNVDIELKGVSPKVINSFITYLNKVRKMYKQKETKDAKKELNKDKKELLEQKWKEFEASIEGNIMDPKVMENLESTIEGNNDLSRKEKKFMIEKLDEKRRKFNETWKSIENIVEQQSSQNSDRTKPEYWQAIRDLVSSRDKRLSIRMDEEMQEQMIAMIDERILEEKDNLYYEQVEEFTRGFAFLMENSEIVSAETGARGKKFTDIESYNRYVQLRGRLQEGHRGEYSKIENLLKNKKIKNGDRRVLEARKAVMEREADNMLEAR